MITKNKYIADIIIVSYGNPDMTIRCVESIKKISTKSYNIFIVDNASPGNTVATIREAIPDIEVIVNDENLGYARAVNIGAAYCKSKYIVISNNDVIYRNGVPDELIELMEKDDNLGVIGPGQEYADGSWQISSGTLPGLPLALKHLFLLERISNAFRKLSKKFFKQNGKLKKVGYVDGAVMLVRRDLFELMNGFDEDFNFYTEEADFCYRIKKSGRKVMNYPELTVTHFRGGANNFGNLEADNIMKLVASKILFCNKHLSPFQTNMYIFIEKFYSFAYFVIFKLFSKASFGGIKEKLLRKAEVMRNFHLAWKSRGRNAKI